MKKSLYERDLEAARRYAMGIDRPSWMVYEDSMAHECDPDVPCPVHGREMTRRRFRKLLQLERVDVPQVREHVRARVTTLITERWEDSTRR